MAHKQKITRFLVLALVVLAIIVLESQRAEPVSRGEAEVVMFSGERNMDRDDRVAEKIKEYPLAREITAPSGFINTGGEEITLRDYIGKKVILLDIWTYSCINCQRSLPFVTAWDRAYRDQGLQVIGIHSPEFEFEKDIKNVQKAVERFGIEYPVVLDNDFGTWTAYENRYWPRKYLIDIDGFVVYDHIGEGGYDQTEEVIQRLLKERATVLGADVELPVAITDTVTAESVDINVERSPEIYFGAWRNDLLANGPQRQEGIFDFQVPSGELRQSEVYLEGSWEITQEYARNRGTADGIVFSYKATKLFVVASASAPIRVFVRIDGEPITKGSAGSHVIFPDDGGDPYLRIDEEQLYRIVEDEVWGQHTLELIPEGAGFEIFTFTFG